MSRPTAVLFDVGNVIVRWDPRTLYSKIFPDPAECGRFLGEVCTMAWHMEHDRGVAMADNAAALIARWPEHAEAIRAWDARWEEMFSGVIEETVEVIQDLHARGVPLFALTNIPGEKADGVFAMSPVFQLFGDMVLSSVEGTVKPEPRIFAIACDRAGRPPQELLFIDDSAANIEAAAALGFHTLLFHDPKALRPQLADLGLL